MHHSLRRLAIALPICLPAAVVFADDVIQFPVLPPTQEFVQFQNDTSPQNSSTLTTYHVVDGETICITWIIRGSETATGQSSVTPVRTFDDRFVELGSYLDSAAPSEVEWFWGDGTSTIGELFPVHSYESQGIYELTVRLTAFGSFSEDSVMLEVFDNSCVQADTVDLRDRATVFASLGARDMTIEGADAFLQGDVTVDGDARIRDRGVLQGDIELSGSLQLDHGSVVTGSIDENVPVSLRTLQTKTVNPGFGYVSVGSGSLSPGTYGHVQVVSGSTLTLQSGEYNFASLFVDTDVDLVVNGDVELNSLGDVNLGDRLDVFAADPEDLVIYSGGAFVRVGNDSGFTGNIIAPNASVTISSRVDYAGCVGGQTVEVQPDTVLDSQGGTLMTL